MIRLDLLLVARGLYASRARARDAIRRGTVRVDGRIAAKPGMLVESTAAVDIDDPAQGFVSRGALKLAHALDHFGLTPEGADCLDIGASTGGFTDVMLKSGARKVHAIDVGYGQLDATLRNDPRVVNREKVNARYLDAKAFGEPIEFVSIDVSFISLKLILPAVATFLDGELVALIKPQFEVGKGDVGKGGIVRDAAKRDEAVQSVVAFAREIGFEVKGVIESPVKGAEGNVEFLMHAARGSRADLRATTPDARP
jgi:23S rRNA (cytidine1920-2'-O)/16S rRNA (cytidine1409-2'-O)-methyltransferase